MTFNAPVGERVLLSILVCTHNRAPSAARLLAQLMPQMRGMPVELILVDSASAAGHQSALQEFPGRYDGATLRLVRLEEKGLSRARNAGLGLARAEWVGCIDDDEMPSPDWVAEALALTKRLPVDCGACGGVVHPDFEPHGGAPLAQRLGQRWRNFLGEIVADGEFDQTKRPKFGAGHCLLRLDAIRAAGGFNSTLGRDGKSLLSGEEVLLLEQMKAQGWRIWHSSRISVLHDIEPERLKKQWAFSRSYWEGVSRARIRRLNGLHNALPAASAAAKTLPLAAFAPFMPAHHEADMRIAYNAGFVVETLRPLLSSLPALLRAPLASRGEKAHLRSGDQRS
jgi:glycosyltransferase involved in cell wall biosynthesis